MAKAKSDADDYKRGFVLDPCSIFLTSAGNIKLKFDAEGKFNNDNASECFELATKLAKKHDANLSCFMPPAVKDAADKKIAIIHSKWKGNEPYFTWIAESTMKQNNIGHKSEKLA